MTEVSLVLIWRLHSLSLFSIRSLLTSEGSTHRAEDNLAGDHTPFHPAPPTLRGSRARRRSSADMLPPGSSLPFSGYTTGKIFVQLGKFLYLAQCSLKNFHHSKKIYQTVKPDSQLHYFVMQRRVRFQHDVMCTLSHYVGACSVSGDGEIHLRSGQLCCTDTPSAGGCGQPDTDPTHFLCNRK